MFFLIVLAGIAIACWAAVIVLFLKNKLRVADLLPLGCLSVIVCGSIFGHPFFNVAVGPLPVTIDRVFWGVLIVTSIVLVIYRWETFTRFDRLDFLVYGLLAVIALSTFSHDWQYKEQLPFRRLIFLNIMPVGLYWVARQSTFGPRQIKLSLLVFSALGLYLSVTGICEWRDWTFAVFPSYISSEQYEEFLGRARGPFLNPIVNGIYLCTCMAALTLMWPHSGRIGKWAIVLLLPIFLLGIYATLTRSIWLTAAATLFVTVWLPSPRQWKGLMICGGTVGMFLVIVLFSSKFNSFKRDKYVTAAEMSESVELRPMLAFVASKMIRDKPLFGHGFGQYTAAKKPYHYNETNQMELRKILPYMQHNVFLSFLTETGFVGCSLLVLILATTAWKAWLLWMRKNVPTVYRQIGLLFLVVVGAYVLNGMFHDVSIIPMCGTLMMFFVGMLANIYNKATVENLDPGIQKHPSSQAAMQQQFELAA